eukprot:jgi/Hompol1/6554/HPOL_000221-RA
MERTERTELALSFPLPPAYFRNYTDSNVEAHEAAASSLSAATASFAATHSAQPLAREDQQQQQQQHQHQQHRQQPLPNLNPPALVTRPIAVFGSMLDIQAPVVPPLESMGIPRLFSDAVAHSLPGADRAAELKRLNHSLLYNFLYLLDLLIKDPEQAQQKTEHIRLILINMHHLLNELRPHQARDMLAIMMQEQIARRRKTTQSLREHIAAVKRELR